MTFWQIVLAFLALILGIFIYFWQEMPSEINVWATSMSLQAEENRENFSNMNKSAFVLGYTGETGKALVQELIKSKVFSRVVLIGRREVKYDDDRNNFEQKIVDFDNIEHHSEAFAGLDVGFCCMGTTKGKSGKDGFYKVDHDYVVNSAKVAKEGGCSHFHLVSSQAANANSLFFYTKTKGEVEEELKTMGFDRLTIYRPAVLMCDREESRPAESCFRTLMKPMQAAFPTFITVPTTTLAKALINAAVSPSNQTVETLENKAIHQLSGDLKSKKGSSDKKSAE